MDAAQPEMRLENLTHVHTAGDAQGIEHDVDRRSVLEERHVLDGEHLRDDPLVPVPSGHLVADRDLPLRGDVDLHHLQHAAGQFVAALHAVECLVAEVDRLLDRSPSLLEQLLEVGFLLRAAQVEVLEDRGEVDDVVGHQLVVVLDGSHFAAVFEREVTAKNLLKLLEKLQERRADRFVSGLLRLLQLLLELLALELREAHPTGEPLRVNHDSLDAAGDFERFVLHVFAGTAEDGVQQLFFGRQLRLGLGRDFADQDVAGLHPGADADDPLFVEVPQGLFADVRECRA